MQYIVVFSDGSQNKIQDRHEKKVNDLIKLGWKPLGGVSGAYVGLSVFLWQAMIKE